MATSKPTLANTLDGILRAFKAASDELVGRRIVEAAIIGGSLRVRYQGNGKLGAVVGDIGIRDVTLAEQEELEESIELGQVQIYTTPLFVSGRIMTKEVLHEATGLPLDPNSEAVRRQQERLALAYGKPVLEAGWTRVYPNDETTLPKWNVRVRAKVRNSHNNLEKEATLYRAYEVETDVTWRIHEGGELFYDWEVVAWQPL